MVAGSLEHFASLGARVVVHGRDEARTREVVTSLTSSGRESAAITGDLADVETCRGAAEFTIDRSGIDIR